jgi:hypothetical protein
VFHRSAPRALLFLVCLALLAPSGEGGCGGGVVTELVPLAGDTHHHSGSLISEFVAYQKQAGLTTACPHDFGKPLHVYDRNQAAGYDWLVIAHHDRATHGGMTGDPKGTAVYKSHPGAYTWWTDPRSAPLRLRSGALLSDPNPLGLPDYRTGGVVAPGWNEPRSFASAAARKNAAGGFVAFAGREFTTNEGAATSAQRGTGGHKVAVLPGVTDRICGHLGTAQGRANDCDETGLYDYVFEQGGVIIQAHPGDWAAGMSTWHPDLRPAGLADVFVHGVEIGSTGGLRWEDGYQTALARGYRVFPSFGSDRHKLQLEEMGIGCSNSPAPSLAYGAVICWAPRGSGPQALADAMRARRCYYARSYEPRLSFALQDDPQERLVQMGGITSAGDRVATVRVAATNDLRNQPARRFGRLELVQPSGSPAQERVAYACTGCCTRNDATGDRCTLNASVRLADGAVYARICSGTAPCGRNGASTLLVSAPIFVNWAAYKRAHGLSLDTTYDFDRDGWPAVWDNCWTDANPGQQDADADRVGDACDVCPYTPDPLQLDANRDGVGDACSGTG